MKKRTLGRLLAAGAALLLALTAASCSGRANPYVSRPQDGMILFQKDGRVYLTNTDGAGYTAEGSASGEMNRDVVPLASGSAYYLEEGDLWYKSYLEPAYKVAPDVRTVFYSIGSVFGVTGSGDLIRTGDGAECETVLHGIDLSGSAPFLESDNNVYVSAGGALFRLVFGGSPEKMQTVKGKITFLTGDAKAVYYAADGAIWSLGHEAVAVKKISGSGSAEPIPLSSRASFGTKLFWRNGDGKAVAYDIASGKSAVIGDAGEGASGRVLPENASAAEVFVLTDGEKSLLYDYKTGKVSALPGALWVYAADGYVYGFDREGLLVFDGNEISKGEKGRPFDLDSPEEIRALATPDGYYYLTGEKEGYRASLNYLAEGKANLVSEGVWGKDPPRAVHRYGGVSFFTGSAIYILDEETHQAELFAEHGDIRAFVPRSGGAFALYGDGLLELMIYGEKTAKTVAEGVDGIFDVLYAPERLVTYPLP
ncbi:MAG: hypothetical protein IKX85_07505 [Clostridia bacterium]|nr:hypothetical protein [Clostridia bacterium]